ncbi:hypothetical protein Tco_0725712 [Tanacetum coccineum]|uniref:Uncharacterized protein n=1 Tax=Tanacetum coccineum TaxID=301880 RepID=A0ABQ4YEJ2_9ASTR
MLAHDEEIARKMQEDWETEEERKRLAEEEATNAALIQDFDDIKARIEADRLLALRLQEEERESSSLCDRAGYKERKARSLKMIARKRKRPQPDVDSNDEHREYLKIVTFKGTIHSEIMERKSVIARLNKVSSPDGDYFVIYKANRNFRAFNCLLEYSEITLEGIKLILWEDLKIMMESSTEENGQSDFWNDQQDWKIDLLQRMLDLGLEVERESTAALDLIRFIKQQIDEKVFNSSCFMVKGWLVHDQTVLGKDYSNLLIAGSLLKTIWFINAPCYGNEALASPKANGVDYARAERLLVNEYRIVQAKDSKRCHRLLKIKIKIG